MSRKEGGVEEGGVIERSQEKAKELMNKLTILYSLQIIDLEIEERKALQGDLPRQVQELEDTIIGAQAKGQSIANEVHDMEKKIRTLEQKKKESALKKAKAEANLEKVRTSEEYNKLQKEIENHELDIQLTDKEIGALKERIKTLSQEKKKLEEEISEKEKVLNERKKELNETLKIIEKDLESLLKIASEIEEKVQEKDVRLLRAYKKIKARMGDSIARIERDACSGCHYRVPIQQQIEIKQYQKVIVCEYCGRILISDDILGEAYKIVLQLAQKHQIQFLIEKIKEKIQQK